MKSNSRRLLKLALQLWSLLKILIVVYSVSKEGEDLGKDLETFYLLNVPVPSLLLLFDLLVTCVLKLVFPFKSVNTYLHLLVVLVKINATEGEGRRWL